MTIGNPIKSIDGVAFTPIPSKYKYLLQDVSASDSGRTEDGKMDKMRVCQKVKIELEWSYPSIQMASQILTAFNPEYITVEYLDGLSGSFQTKEFYVGDRSSPFYNVELGLWENVAFNIIER